MNQIKCDPSLRTIKSTPLGCRVPTIFQRRVTTCVRLIAGSPGAQNAWNVIDLTGAQGTLWVCPPGTPRCPSSNRPRKKLFLPAANAQKWTVTRMLLGERNGKHVSLALRKRRYLNVQRHFTEIQEQPAPGTREDPWAQLQITRRVLESCFSTR